MLFSDRRDAGKRLASHLESYRGSSDMVVLGLARGGVVVAYEVAIALKLPLSAIVVRKLGAPHNEELAIGAITDKGEGVFNEQLIGLLGVSREYLLEEIERQKQVAARRLHIYRGNCPPPHLQNKTVILVDDGIATGASVRAAVRSIRLEGARKIILAIPVAAPEALSLLKKEVDEVVCLYSPVFFEAVGTFYKLFTQTTDEEIIHFLEHAAR